jgi:hypothetical protein
MIPLSLILYRTFGDVIEFGLGYYSTSLIAHICYVMNRKSESYEINKSWLANINKHFENQTWLLKNHKNILIENYETIDLENRKFSVCFIDQEPVETRTKVAVKMMDKSDFIVIHDSEPFRFDYETIYPLFKYQYQFSFFEKDYSRTCILSNKMDPKLLIGLE